MIKAYKQYSLCILAAILLAACAGIPAYTQNDLDKITALKQEAAALMSETQDNYANHAEELTNFNTRMREVINSAKQKKDNTEIIKQFTILNDPNGSLLGKALADWKTKGTLSKVYAEGLEANIAAGFDQIIALVEHHREAGGN
jgi:preprotein translocase subunit Sec63